MAKRSYIRVGLYSTYLLLLFGLMLYGYASLARFDGYMRVEEGKGESVAFADAAGISPFAPELVLTAELIPFHLPDTARHLSRQTDFVFRTLPFAVHLDSSETLESYPPEHVLVIEEGGEKRRTKAAPGDTLTFAGGERLTLVEFSDWKGLLRDVRGLPSMALSARNAQGETGLLMAEAGAWLFPDEGVSVQLVWHENAAAVQQAVSGATRPDVADAWWTLDDGGAVTRFNNFTPGVGADCADGSVWLVEQLVSSPRPELWLRVEEAGRTRRVVAPANTDDPAARARFYHPGAAATCIELHAWRESEAELLIFERDGISTRSTVQAGALLLERPELTLRLTQLLAHGLPAEAQEPPVQQAVLRGEDGREWRIREGSSEYVAEARVAYQREAPAPKLRLRLQANGESFALAPGESHRVAGWVFSPAEGDNSDRHGVYIHARKALFPPHVLLGMACFVAASFGLVWWRFAQR